MKLFVNGEEREFAGEGIEALLLSLELAPAVSLVEHNGVALRRDEWPTRELREGDRLEIVRIVAGG